MSVEQQRRRRGRPGGLDGPALLAAARAIFLREGYAATTMDAVAAACRISKQTLYRSHASKEQLFAAVVADWVDRGRDAMRAPLEAALTSQDVRAGLLELARAMHAGVLSAPVVQMRSLVIAEAERLPGVALDYVARSWDRNEASLSEALETLAARGALRIDDATIAAQQFTWLVLGPPLDRMTLTAGAASMQEDRLETIRLEAVTTFFARYGPVVRP